MKHINEWPGLSESEINEASNVENLKLILAALKDASQEQLDKIAALVGKKLTYGNIMDLAHALHLEDKIVKG